MNECCLVTTHCLDRDGYARAKVKGKMIRLHKAAWEKYHRRKVPPGKIVMHLCDVKPCIRRSHLQLGTNLLNSRDMVAKGRQHCGTGLPPATVRNILTSLASCRVLALRYGVGKSTIHRIRNRQVQNV